MKKLIIILTGLLMLLGALVFVGFLFYFSFGFAEEGLFIGAGASTATMEESAADYDAPAERMEAAQPEIAAPAAESSAQKVAASAPLPTAVFATDAKVIRNGTLSIVVENPAAALTSVEQIVAGIPGAFIATAEVRRAGDSQPTSLTLRVPAEAFDQALSALRALAQEVLAEQTAARDVTEEYTDLDARLRNLRAAETQLLALLEQSDAVEDLLKVENRLAEVRGEIERLQGRLNVLENRIALATIHVLLHAPPDLSVVLAAENLPVAHEVTTFVLTYRNEGSVTARDGILVLWVPEFLSVIGMGHGGVYDPLSRKIRWSLSDIAPGSVNSVYVQLRVEATEKDIELHTHFQSASAELDEANNTAYLTLSFAPDLTLQVDGPASGAQGNTIPIWVYYANAGTGDATDVTIRTTLPPGLTFVRATSGGSYDRDTSTIVWQLGLLQAGAGSDLRIDMRVDVAEGRLQIPIAIAADPADAVGFNNRTELFFTALREDVSARSVWQPGQTVETSFAALIVVARTAVDVLIWLLTFGIPLAIVGLLGLGVRVGMRRLRRGQGAQSLDE
ncbi:MAG: DUF4349 domain-containing protein [Chloroflexota bacterium]|nr:DUF4349 domain-containing protein [Chloroflexota bacterium]MDE2840717.1 DUF4349 domain-containing protein [Chloroflexota bacterium]MDE2931751.1 DUF4349 domain-containing protein [Chloroflexota bacterium]